jgi:hypothetical protein
MKETTVIIANFKNKITSWYCGCQRCDGNQELFAFMNITSLLLDPAAPTYIVARWFFYNYRYTLFSHNTAIFFSSHWFFKMLPSFDGT